MMITRMFLTRIAVFMVLLTGTFSNMLVAKTSLPPAAEQYAVTDKDITVAVEARLLVDPHVPEQAIDVETQDGIVRLSGSVPSLLAKDRAAKIVKTVRGVQAIIQDMDVKPVPQIGDEELRGRVMHALKRDPATDSYDVSVSSQQGVVVLEGTVDSWQEKQLAGQVARSLQGVVKLENRLQVRPAPVRPDDEIEAEVIRRLQSNVWIDGKLIGVMVKGGKVTLSGTVGSLAEKYSAFTSAWVSGVIAVNVDPLQIEWWARDKMRRNPAELFRTGEQIQEALRRAWKYDPRVDPSQIEMQIENGIMTLAGVVTDLRAKRAAEEDAKNTIGVFRVRNFLKVRPAQTISDEKLKEWVQEAFQEQALIDRYEIKISVQGGTVFLDGYVDSFFELALAVETAEDVKGVREVVSRLEHEPMLISKEKNDKEIWYDIMQAIWWDPRLYQENIHVEVEGGEVTFSGTVTSLQERQLLAQMARDAGAVHIHNQVNVKHAPAFLSSKG